MSLQDRTYKAPAIQAQPGNESPVSGDGGSVLGDPSSTREDKKTLDPKGKNIADEVAALEDEEESYGFAHPAASRPQRTVWIPKDTLGLAEEEERACKEMGVSVSYVHATMDGTGKVDVTGGPPDLIQ